MAHLIDALPEEPKLKGEEPQIIDSTHTKKRLQLLFHAPKN
jgi:hypothetical protein